MLLAGWISSVKEVGGLTLCLGSKKKKEVEVEVEVEVEEEE